MSDLRERIVFFLRDWSLILAVLQVCGARFHLLRRLLRFQPPWPFHDHLLLPHLCHTALFSGEERKIERAGERERARERDRERERVCERKSE